VKTRTAARGRSGDSFARAACKSAALKCVALVRSVAAGDGPAMNADADNRQTTTAKDSLNMFPSIPRAFRASSPDGATSRTPRSPGYLPERVNAGINDRFCPAALPPEPASERARFPTEAEVLRFPATGIAHRSNFCD
jgi:hypothetical protein